MFHFRDKQMASVIPLDGLSYDWLGDHIDEQDEPITDEDIPLLLEEIRQSYDVNVTEHDNRDVRDEDEACETLNEAIKNLPGPPVRSCGSCTKAERIEDVHVFSKGQHISMPGEMGTKYDRRNNKLKYFYEHHAVVKEVKTANGMKAKLVLIHFTRGKDRKLKIYETTKVYDLRKHEIYLVKYMHPRYEPDEIVQRAESMLLENREPKAQFDTYNMFVRNCEHFVTWCVTGKKGSFQIQSIKQKVADLFKLTGSILAKKALMRLLFSSADEIAKGLSSIACGNIVLAASAGVYLLYCIIMTVSHIKDFENGHICKPCLKGKIFDLWMRFGIFGTTSLLSWVLIDFAIPLIGSGPGIALTVLLVLLSVVLQWSVPKIRRALQSPFQVDKKKISDLSEVKVGDIISFDYFKLEHAAIVTEVDHSKYEVRCVHYSWPIPGNRTIKEEYFQLNPSKKTVKIFDCSALNRRPNNEVVQLARERVGEMKWSAFNRSDHLCFWAKVKGVPRVLNGVNNNTDESETSRLSSAFIREDIVHLVNDLHPGDVVTYKRHLFWSIKGILVGIKSLDIKSRRQFEIEMMVYGSFCYIRRQTYEIDLNRDELTVSVYHHAHCHSMNTRVQRALAMKDEKGKRWTTNRFIMDCIMLSHP